MTEIPPPEDESRKRIPALLTFFIVVPFIVLWSFAGMAMFTVFK
jgi:hypothetical protein